MKTLLSLFLFLTAPLLANSQQTLTGKVLDALSEAPVPWTNIGLSDGTSGTVSDEQGAFSLLIQQLNDTVVFSSIGYQTPRLTGRELLTKPQVRLTPATYSLPVVEVTPDMLDNAIVIGSRLEKRNYSVSFGSNQLGAGVGALLTVEQPTFLEKAYFVLNHAKGDSLLLRVNLYSYDEQKGLGPSLLPRNIIIAAPQQRGAISADLSDLRLVVEGSVLLCLEWVKDDNGKGNQGITFRARKSRAGNNMFVKRSSVGAYRNMADEYEGFPGTQLGFYLTGKSKK